MRCLGVRCCELASHPGEKRITAETWTIQALAKQATCRKKKMNGNLTQVQTLPFLLWNSPLL